MELEICEHNPILAINFVEKFDTLMYYSSNVDDLVKMLTYCRLQSTSVIMQFEKKAGKYLAVIKNASCGVINFVIRVTNSTLRSNETSILEFM
uniref:Uncharacterized protein n=1 Tax=Romanomermis culicivorax TaxID=13658 RepID=A0A915JEB4_ROMCU